LHQSTLLTDKHFINVAKIFLFTTENKFNFRILTVLMRIWHHLLTTTEDP